MGRFFSIFILVLIILTGLGTLPTCIEYLSVKSSEVGKIDDVQKSAIVEDKTSYSISYNLDGGTADNPSNYTLFSADFTLNNPTKDGYVFTGWTNEDIAEPKLNVTICKGSAGDLDFTANYKIFLKTPELVRNDYLISWQSVEKATAYQIYINDVKVDDVVETQIDIKNYLTTLNNGLNNIYVYSSCENSVSDKSNVINFNYYDVEQFNNESLNLNFVKTSTTYRLFTSGEEIVYTYGLDGTLKEFFTDFEYSGDVENTLLLNSRKQGIKDICFGSDYTVFKLIQDIELEYTKNNSETLAITVPVRILVDDSFNTELITNYVFNINIKSYFQGVTLLPGDTVVMNNFASKNSVRCVDKKFYGYNNQMELSFILLGTDNTYYVLDFHKDMENSNFNSYIYSWSGSNLDDWNLICENEQVLTFLSQTEFYLNDEYYFKFNFLDYDFLEISIGLMISSIAVERVKIISENNFQGYTWEDYTHYQFTYADINSNINVYHIENDTVVDFDYKIEASVEHYGLS